ncbi:STAS domain-containing protein [Streptosporangium sp. NPDC023615]|uniref:STAS domain-containing protein n=1 Tax=Streptosporangium sp. NPDC023615 TaxID=3154794 RepID=UPI003442023B
MSVYVIHQYGDTALVAVLGEMDAFNYRLLESELESLMVGGTRHILVDAGELLFCDVSGARALERVHRSLRAAGGELFVVPSPAVVRLFTVLWGAQEPGHPGLVTSFGLGELSGVPALPARHVPRLRRIGAGRRGRRGSVPLVGAVSPEAPGARTGSPVPASPAARTARVVREGVTPARDAPALAGEVARSSGAGRAPHPALERSARLRREAAARLETLHHRTRATCAKLAEMHDLRLTLHAGLDTHVAVRAAVRTACDDHARWMREGRAYLLPLPSTTGTPAGAVTAAGTASGAGTGVGAATGPRTGGGSRTEAGKAAGADTR